MEQPSINSDQASNSGLETLTVEAFGYVFSSSTETILNDQNLSNLHFERLCHDDCPKVYDNFEDHLKLDFVEKMIELISNFFSQLKNDPTEISNEQTTYFYYSTFKIIWDYSDSSKFFSLGLLEKDFQKLLVELINYEAFINQTESNLDFKYNYRAALGCLHNISNYSYKNIDKWKELKCLECLLDKAKIFKENKNLLMVIYLTIANLFDEEDTKKLTEINEAIIHITSATGKLSKIIEKNAVEREEKVIYESDSKKYPISVITIEEEEWNLVELLNGLYRLSVNDKIKFFMFEDCKMKKYLKRIILHGNLFEKDFGIKLLWQLCFDDRIRETISDDAELVGLIKKLLETKENNSTILNENCEGLIWLLNNRDHSPNAKPAAEKGSEDQIMISYNRDSRALCLLIKEELERKNYKVWIDVEAIHGSSLESMANAIENSKFILICMTEKYKLSSNCRAEAEYAFQLNKKIVPLIMQTGYRPNGWLGIILGSKIYVDYTKYEFNECMDRLFREIKLQNSQGVGNIKNTSNKMLNQDIHGVSKKASDKFDNRSQVFYWKEEEAIKWIEEKKFNAKIIENISPCDGEILYQMYEMIGTVPEFFYNSLNCKDKVNLRDIAFFTKELKKLFNHNI